VGHARSLIGGPAAASLAVCLAASAALAAAQESGSALRRDQRAVRVLWTTFTIDPVCWEGAKTPDGRPMGDAVRASLIDVAAAFQGCLDTYKDKLKYGEKVRETLKNNPMALRCKDRDKAADICGTAHLDEKNPVIDLYPNTFRKGFCENPGETVLHEILHVAGVPMGAGHNSSYGATENDAVYGMAALCWGGTEGLKNMRYSQCKAALSFPEDVQRLCGDKKFDNFYQAMLNAQGDYLDEYCGQGECQPQALRTAMAATFLTVLDEERGRLDLSDDEVDFLKSRYLEDPPHSVDERDPPYYTPMGAVKDAASRRLQDAVRWKAPDAASIEKALR
jgi:hypothetical protein